MSPLRILKVTQVYPPFYEANGQALTVQAIARRLARRGHRVTVLTALRNEHTRSQMDGIEVVYVRSLGHYRAITLSPGVVPFCLRRLGEFDIVHIYGVYDLLGPIVAAMGRRRHMPYVVEPLGMFRPIVRSLFKKRAYHRLIGRRLFAGASRVIATSDQERRDLIDGGIAPERIAPRRNGFDPEEFEPLPARGGFRREIGIGDQTPLVVFLGRLSRKKGLPVLIRALAGLPPDVRLAIVGPDDHDGALQDVERLKREFQLNGRAIVTGPRYGAEKVQALVDADVFVLPSLNENFGNTVAESIACGTPVVVSDQCGIAPFVRDRVGLVVPYNADALQNALARLLGDAGLRERFRANAQGVSRELSWDQPIVEQERLYEELVVKS